MCNYCTCQKNDNTRYHGMRTQPINNDLLDKQANSNYTWNGAPVTNTPAATEPVPPIGDQFRQQAIAGNGSQAGVG